jgi:hypothetical protein
MRGLSGAVTALILVIASVIIALIVVGFAFNLFGNYASQGSNTVSPVGSAYLYINEFPNGTPASGTFLVFTVVNKGPNVNITSVAINGEVYVPYNEYKEYLTSGGNSIYKTVAGVYIPTGTETLMLNFTVNNLPSIVSGSTVPVELRLSSSQTIELTAYVVEG